MTAQPYGTLSPERYRELLRANADAMVAAARTVPLDSRVPSCPDWDVRGLLVHVGQVHEWVREVVKHGDADPSQSTSPGQAEDAIAWYLDQAEQLLHVLETTPPDKPCTGHQPTNKRAAYWARRQAHEVAMHHVDADLAAGGGAHYDASLAADGIAEVLDVWMPLISQRIRPPALTAPVLLACTDTPERWLVSPAPDVPDTEGPEVSATDLANTIRGTASDLLLAMWNRAATVTVTGDAARRFLDSRLTP